MEIQVRESGSSKKSGDSSVANSVASSIDSSVAISLSSEALKFRVAAENDATALAILINSAYRGEGSKQGWTTEADLIAGQRTDPTMMIETVKRNSVLVLENKKGEAVGCVALTKLDCGMIYLGMLTVAPSMQSKGYGDLLLQEAEKFSRETLGSNCIEMTVIQVREELIQWYERRGYKKTGELRPFPYGQDQFGKPLRQDLKFEVLTKQI